MSYQVRIDLEFAAWLKKHQKSSEFLGETLRRMLEQKVEGIPPKAVKLTMKEYREKQL